MNFKFDLPSIYIFLLLPLMILALIVKPRDRMWLAMRMLIYITGFLLILKPYVAVRHDKGSIPQIGLFIDTSLSMSVEGRIGEAKKAAEKILSGLGKRAEIKIYQFSDKIEEIKAEHISRLNPEHNSTDLSGTVSQEVKDARIILTDGRHNSGHSPLAVRDLSRIPVFALGIGGNTATPDLEISDLKIPGFGFRDQEIEVEFSLVNRAYSAGTALVYVKQGKTVVSREQIELVRKKSIPVTVCFTPSEIGLKNYTLEVEKIPGEMNLANNTRSFQIQVNRQKIRMLYVAGQPSWEYSFFRRLVRSDPQVELVSFLILRNPENITIVPEYELSLIHFPAREMFTKKIYEFDLLIYDNFSYARFFPMSYLTHIKNFVLKGGAFIMLGGEDSFGRGGYVNTPIEGILPLAMEPGKSGWQLEEFVPRPRHALSHPVLNIAENQDISAKIWKEIPPLEGFDPTLKPKPESTVLLETSGGLPILAVMNAGKGRAMALNTNTTWRWCMGLAGMGKTPYYYNQFWQKVIRYMIQSSYLKNVQVFPGKDRANLGERISVNIKVVDRYWNPVNHAIVKIQIETPAGKKIPMGRAYPAGEEGWHHAEIPVTEQGIYKIKAFAYEDDRFLGEGEGSFTGISLNREMENTSLNRGLLEDIARISGGYYWDIGSFQPDMLFEKIREIAGKKTKTTRKMAWNHAAIYGLLVFIICAEWYIRRRRGLS